MLLFFTVLLKSLCRVACAMFESICAFRRAAPKLGMAKVFHVDFPPRETVFYTKETQTPTMTVVKEGDAPVMLKHSLNLYKVLNNLVALWSQIEFFIIHYKHLSYGLSCNLSYLYLHSNLNNAYMCRQMKLGDAFAYIGFCNCMYKCVPRGGQVE